jgi:hypothetical protein
VEGLTDVSFDEWWTGQLRTTLLRGYECSSIGIVLRWLGFWDQLEVEEVDIDELSQSWNGGALWTSCGREEGAVFRVSSLQFFRSWYNAQISTQVQHIIGASLKAKKATIDGNVPEQPVVSEMSAVFTPMVRKKRRHRASDDQVPLESECV